MKIRFNIFVKLICIISVSAVVFDQLSGVNYNEAFTSFYESEADSEKNKSTILENQKLQDVLSDSDKNHNSSCADIPASRISTERFITQINPQGFHKKSDYHRSSLYLLYCSIIVYS